MGIVEQMKKFVEPRSVALFGVSRRTGENARNILEHLLNYGYQGRIYPVNPNATEILGVKTYFRVTDISDEIDLAVINLPRSLVPRIVKECIEQGIRAIIIVTQGFAEAADEEGKQLQKQIDEFVNQSGVRILGPNSLGIANAFINFCSSFVRLDMVKVPIGIICQTGAFFTSFPELRFVGKGIDLGNACDVNFADALEYFEQDAETKIVALHIEGIRDSKRFIKAASRLAHRKPVLALKTGRNEHAAEVVHSHTGSLAGKDEIWEAMLKQSGVIRVSDIDELSDLVRAFLLLPLMKGRKIGIVSNSGGLGIISIDACYRFNVEIAELSSITMKRINVLSPSWQSIGNPADMWPAVGVAKHPYTKVLKETTDAVFSDDNVSAVFLMWWLPTHRVCADFCHILGELAETYQDKPLVCFFTGAYAEAAKNKLEATGRIAVFPTPGKAIRALAYLARYSAFRGGF